MRYARVVLEHGSGAPTHRQQRQLPAAAEDLTDFEPIFQSSGFPKGEPKMSHQISRTDRVIDLSLCRRVPSIGKRLLKQQDQLLMAAAALEGFDSDESYRDELRAAIVNMIRDAREETYWLLQQPSMILSIPSPDDDEVEELVGSRDELEEARRAIATAAVSKIAIPVDLSSASPTRIEHSECRTRSESASRSSKPGNTCS